MGFDLVSTYRFVKRNGLGKFVAVVLGAWLVSACATHQPTHRHAFELAGDPASPLVVVADYDKTYNRIGRVEAKRLNSGNVDLYVNPDRAAVYVDRKSFVGASGTTYTNHYYRLHFQRVPYSIVPFYITAGRNGGLFIIVTVDQSARPVLITTVHTCGCYLAFVPTSALAEDALPRDWPRDRQSVYGESLPASLALPNDPSKGRIAVYLRHGTHRVSDVRVLSAAELGALTRHSAIPLPIESLNKIAIDEGETVSLFYESGSRRGYVKYAFKPWELLLMSWWALDPFIGQDKKLGDPAETGTIFYTSLKPWNRAASNLWPFENFLRFWGWRM